MGNKRGDGRNPQLKQGANNLLHAYFDHFVQMAVVSPSIAR